MGLQIRNARRLIRYSETLAMPQSEKGLKVLMGIMELLESGGDIRTILDEVLKLLSRELGLKRGMISLVKADFTEVYLDVAPDFRKKDLKTIRYGIGEGITGQVVKTGRPLAVPKLDEAPLFLDRTGLRKEINRAAYAFICVPIKYKDEVIGALSVDTVSAGKAALEVEVFFLEAVSKTIAHIVYMQRTREEEKRLEKENIRLRKQLESAWKPNQIIGNSRPMREVYSLIEQVADSNTTVLVTGETGTGKELTAAAIHEASPRRDGPFVRVNCAVFPENLLENELFGHEKGAYTGASEKHIGRFERANGGTIFLDEIGELSLSAQIKLLRILQEKEFERVGGTETIKVNVRVIAATNKDMEKAVDAGEFRLDLFYRLNVFPIHMPPLRKRGADVMLLADSFVQKYSKEIGKEVTRICTPAIDMIMAYHWPGNVRELENCIERAVLLAKEGVIHSYNLPPSLQMESKCLKKVKGGTLEKMVAAYERDLIAQELKNSFGNQSETARKLGTTKRVIQYKVQKYEIDCAKFKQKS